MPAQVDLDAYFARVEWSGPTTATFATLAGILRAHTAHVAFENLDVLLGRPVRLDLQSLQHKLVRSRRGGYCFEQATLFAAVLQQIGFYPTCHAARVVLFDPPARSPRTHMFLTVPVDGATYVVDPGFGPFAAPFPVPLSNAPTGQSHWMTQEANFWAMHVPHDGQTVTGWLSTLEIEHPIDFELANHYTATHPASPFTNIMMLSAPTPGGRVSVMNRGVTIRNGAQETSMQLPDRAALRALLAEHFGFDLPEVEHMKVPAIPEWL
jgi:N-hydroxyarylamine O-acetyltransferase